MAENLTDQQILEQASAEMAAEDAAQGLSSQSVTVSAPPVAEAATQVDTLATPEHENTTAPLTLREILNPEWKDRSDEEAAREIASAFDSARRIHQQNQEMQQYLASQKPQLDQYQQHQAQFQQWLAAQQATQQPQQQAKFWEPAPYDQSWEAFRDPNSPTGFRDGTPADVVVGWNRYVGNQREFFNKLRTDWDGSVGSYVDQRAKSIAEQAIEDRVTAKLNEFNARLEAQQFVQQNADWLAQRDPLTGQVGLSPAGQQMHTYMGQLQSAGVQDAGLLRALAAKLMTADILSAQQQQAAFAPPAAATNGHNLNQEHKNRLLQAGAMRQPNRGGTIPHSTDAAPQNSKLSLEQMIREELAAQGN